MHAIHAEKPRHTHQIEAAPPDVVRRLQDRLLKRQLEYLAEKSPFYARKLAESGRPDLSFESLDDLTRLPFTVKDEIRRSLASRTPLGDHLAADEGDLVQFHCSSGTTGRPSYVGLTSADVAGESDSSQYLAGRLSRLVSCSGRWLSWSSSQHGRCLLPP